MTAPDTSKLPDMLLHWAGNQPGLKEAVRLIITSWLDDDAFVAECVKVADEKTAFISWLEVDQFITAYANDPDTDPEAEAIVALRLARSLGTAEWRTVKNLAVIEAARPARSPVKPKPAARPPTKPWH